MSEYYECPECGTNKFMSEWDRVECENGHGVDGGLPLNRRAPAQPAQPVEAKPVRKCDKWCNKMGDGFCGSPDCRNLPPVQPAQPVEAKECRCQGGEHRPDCDEHEPTKPAQSIEAKPCVEAKEPFYCCKDQDNPCHPIRDYCSRGRPAQPEGGEVK